MTAQDKAFTDLQPCAEAVDFCSQFPTIEAAWLACERSDWMLWLAARRGVEYRILCAMLVDLKADDGVAKVYPPDDVAASLAALAVARKRYAEIVRRHIPTLP